MIFHIFVFGGVLCCNVNVVASWPQYESGTKLVLRLQRDNITSITDGMWASITLHDTPVPYDIYRLSAELHESFKHARAPRRMGEIIINPTMVAIGGAVHLHWRLENDRVAELVVSCLLILYDARKMATLK